MDEIGVSPRSQCLLRWNLPQEAAAFTSSNYSNTVLLFQHKHLPLSLCLSPALPVSPRLYISLIIVIPHVEMVVSTPHPPLLYLLLHCAKL